MNKFFIKRWFRNFFFRGPTLSDLSGPLQIQLISIHIPKTAGTSFRNILEYVYGEKQVLRVDITLASEKTPFSTTKPAPAKLPPWVTVLHGHFKYPDLLEKYDLAGSIPVITWLRDPVERVISNYFYLQKILRGIIKEEQRSVNILSKIERTLIEYARADMNRNRMSKFLGGTRLSALAFVGIQEYFSEDLHDLASMFHWPKVKEVHHNSSRKTKAMVDQDTKREILKLNRLDSDLYQKALQLRQKRRKENKSNGER